AVRAPRRACLRRALRLPRAPLGVRAAHLRAAARRRRPAARGVHARLLPAGPRPVPRGHDRPAGPGLAQAAQAAAAGRDPSRDPPAAVRAARRRGPHGAPRPRPGTRRGLSIAVARAPGPVAFTATRIGRRVAELADGLAADHPATAPVLVALPG